MHSLFIYINIVLKLFSTWYKGMYINSLIDFNIGSTINDLFICGVLYCFTKNNGSNLNYTYLYIYFIVYQ